MPKDNLEIAKNSTLEGIDLSKDAEVKEFDHEFKRLTEPGDIKESYKETEGITVKNSADVALDKLTQK